MYIYQYKNWPQFTWNTDEIIHTLSEVRNMQGKIIGRMMNLGFDLKSEANLTTLTLDTIKTTEIEGEILDENLVRSSIAERLGIEIAGIYKADRNIDGIVELILDAAQNNQLKLSKQRLLNWHYALFPFGRNGMYKINVGKWREDTIGPMQVVSGAMGKEKVHFQAPNSSKIEQEMKQFIKWFNTEKETEPVIKAAIAHLWFVTIHPFDDGNGRIARALTDLLLARSDGSTQRFYSMSAQIRKERKSYYKILEETQKESLDITEWLKWFLNCLLNALNSADEILNKIFKKSEFWTLQKDTILNSRQHLILNKLLDGFDGKLSSSKWAKIAKCSADTALRDIQDLIDKNILKKEAKGGRSTHYNLI